MMMIVFRTRLRPDADLTALEALGRRMADLVARMPGFVSHADYASPDGESLTVVFFASDLAAFVNGQILQVDGGR